MDCSIPAGIGKDHAVRVDYNQWSFLSSSVVASGTGSGNAEFIRVGYLPPSLDGAVLSDPLGLDTTGGEQFEIYGTNFGASTEDASLSNVTVLYRIPGSTPTYAASSCSITVDHERAVCLAASGVGKAHDFVIWVGGQRSSWTQLPGFYYRPPLVSSLSVDPATSVAFDPDASYEYGTAPLGDAIEDAELPSRRLRASGGTTVVLQGGNFGPLGGGHSVVGVFAPSDAFSSASDILELALRDGSGDAADASTSSWFLRAPCSIDISNSQIHCVAPAGLGSGLVWYVMVANQISASAAPNATSYESPLIELVSGPGARNGTTEGGEDVYVDGVFGPPLSDLPDGVVSRIEAHYGMAPGLQYSAGNCSVVDAAGTRLLCQSAAGSGRGHSWRVSASLCARAADQPRASWIAGSCSGASSVVLHAMTAYAPPVVAQVYGTGAESPTSGGVEIKIQGANFGPTIDAVEFVGFEMLESVASDTSQAASTSDLTQSAFDLSEWATEMALAMLAGQTTANQAADAASAGLLGSTLPLHIPSGFDASAFDTFPPMMDESAVHFPRGPAAWDITSSCEMTTAHSELRCIMPPGAGSGLRWQAIVSEQQSVQP